MYLYNVKGGFIPLFRQLPKSKEFEGAHIGNNNAPMIDVRIQKQGDPSRSEVIKCLLDTGATGSVLDLMVIERLGLPKNGVPSAVMTGSGPIEYQPYDYFIDFMSPNAPGFKGIILGAHFDEALNNRMVIGWDLMRFFQVKLDWGANEVSLEKLSGP